MSESRTRNTKRNIISGLLKQFTNIILPFATRTIFLYLLGATYQGLNGLFTSVLHVLNLADLGFSSAVVFALYKPIAEKDEESTCAITAYLKRAYRIVGLSMIAIGCAFMPFLHYVIADGYPTEINIYIIYTIYLVNNALSYLLFGYKSAILTAMQREDVISIVSTCCSFLIKGTQILVLVLTRNFYYYAAILPITTIIHNIIIGAASKRMFPQVVPQGHISADIKKKINKQVKALFIDKVCDCARNSLDNIIISSLIGLTMVAIYDNYYYIYSSLYAIMLIVSRAMQASVGDSVASESLEKNYNDFNKFNTVYMVITGWFSICMAVLYQPFMRLWMRNNEEMIFPTWIMLLFCVYFYFINMNNIRNLYIGGSGLYWECRIWYIVEAIANLALNILLGKIMGVSGIIIATIITIIAFNFVARTNIVFKSYFKRSPLTFYKNSLWMFLLTAVIGLVLYVLSEMIPVSGITGLLIKGAICCTIPFAFFLIYRRDNYFLQGVSFLLRKK